MYPDMPTKKNKLVTAIEHRPMKGGPRYGNRVPKRGARFRMARMMQNSLDKGLSGNRGASGFRKTPFNNQPNFSNMVELGNSDIFV